MNPTMSEPGKSLESWIWDTTCSIRGAKDAGDSLSPKLPQVQKESVTIA